MVEPARILIVASVGWIAALAPAPELGSSVPHASATARFGAGQPSARHADTFPRVEGARGGAAGVPGVDAAVGDQRHVDASAAATAPDRCEYSVQVRGTTTVEDPRDHSRRTSPSLAVDASVTCAGARVDGTDILAGTAPLEPAELERLLERRATIVVGGDNPCAYLPDLAFADGKLSVRSVARLCAAGPIADRAHPELPDVDPVEDRLGEPGASQSTDARGDRVHEPTGRLQTPPLASGTSAGDAASTHERRF